MGELVQPSLEEWRDIPGWEGEYQVSDQGHVRSFKGWHGMQLLNPSLDAYGYFQFSMKRRPLEKKVKVHRVVWIAFRGEIPEGHDIDHLNGIKTDNRLINLECVTKQENHRRATAMGLKAKGSKSGVSKLNEDQVLEIYAAPRDRNSRRTLAAKYGVSLSLVVMIQCGKGWSWLTKKTA